MSIILTESEAKALLTKVLNFSKADGCEVNLLGEERGNLRYARNEVSTSGAFEYVLEWIHSDGCGSLLA